MDTLVKTDAYSADHADGNLDYLLREWQSIPSLAEEWDEWDDGDRLNFELDWPVRESYLKLLSRWNDEGLLTTDQRERYHGLLRLVGTTRPLLERLFLE